MAETSNLQVATPAVEYRHSLTQGARYLTFGLHTQPLKKEFPLNNVQTFKFYFTGNTLHLYYRVKPLKALW
jgi:hypothetical protein